VIYQIYPRSFQDSDGDGIGDLAGVTSRLDHLRELGVDGLWLSPIYPSPLADGGYDIADHAAVDPRLGTLDDLDELLAAAHERGLRVLLDLVPSHTSIEHPWFREHPDWYVWADDGPPNNWLSAFGGPAWSRDPESGRWYLHSFFPEQPDLDWRNPDVHEAIAEVVRFWLERGVDGFRVDAVERLSKDPDLRDDPAATEPPLFPLHEEYGSLRHVYSRNFPGVEKMLATLRRAAGDAVLVGEVFRPASELGAYLEYFDMVFAFEFMFARWDAETLAAVIAPAERLRRTAWVLSNHDFTRIATRIGEENVRLAALLQLTLPGAAFLYQGDELGLTDGPGADPPYDRHGRDRARHAMQWDGSERAGFTSGDAWLPPVDPARRNVAEQRGDRRSLLELYRRLIRLRRSVTGELELLAGEPDLLAYRRGEHVVALNFGNSFRPAPEGELVVGTDPSGEVAEELPPGAGVVVRSGG
jgi:alpha-glucosidase